MFGTTVKKPEPIPSLARPKGEHVRVVFKEGRDLNIFGVVDTNVQGGTIRYKDHAGDTFIVYPEAVNYLQIKQEK